MSNKLKDALVENVPTYVKIVENKGEQHGDYKGKPTVSYWYKIELEGVIYDHSASPTEMKILGLIHEGETAVVKKVKNKYGNFSCYWAPEDDISARVTQVKSNTQVIREEKAVEDYNSKKEEVVISQILHGFMCASMSAGKTVKESGEKADEAFHVHHDLVKKIVESKKNQSKISAADLPF